MLTTCALLLVAYTHGFTFGQLTPLERYADSSPLGYFVQAVTNASRTVSGIPGISPEIRGAINEMYSDTNVAMGPHSDGITEKCCGRYGCFSSKPPFGDIRRPLLPMCQDDLRIKFYMWTKENPEFRYLIDNEDSNTMINFHFRSAYCIFIFIHGYLGSGDASYIRDMKDAILREKGCIFISVDWTYGARMVPHASIANIQMVSAVVASFIQKIMDSHNVGPEKFHLAGLGSGAHAVGGVGKRIPGIGRITGFDPLKPYFEDAESTIRLSTTDASFVDVIYTDISTSGMKAPCGHVNIYVNGGYAQPACYGVAGCNHLMGLFYFIDSIQANCPYLAYQCEGWDNFMRGKCSIGCGHENSLCVALGYDAVAWKPRTEESPALFYMATQARRSYCVQHYYVEINCTDDRIRLWRYGRNTDKLFINLIGDTGQTGLQLANENSIRYTTSHATTTVITSDYQIGPIRSIILKWVPTGGVLPNENCQNERIPEPTANCCIEILEPAKVRCLMCPYTVSSIYAKNLETGQSARYGGIAVFLQPNLESVFNLNKLQNY